MHQTSLAFLASRQLFSRIGINKIGWKEETMVMCVHSATVTPAVLCPCIVCLYHRLPIPEELMA